LRLIEPVRFLLRKQSEHDGAAIRLIEISLSFFFPSFFVYSPLCVSSIQSDSACSSFVICGVGYFCPGEFVDVPAARAIDLSNTEWLGEKLVLCNKFEILSFLNLCFFAL
jgi:hypothetical protein